MMSKDNILKLASVLIAIVLLVAAFVFVLGDEEGPNVLGGVQTDVQFEEVDLLTQRLNEIATINIDDTFFEDPVFHSLKDYRQEIYQYEQGRENPFEALEPIEEVVINGGARQEGEVIVIDLPSS